jgi:septum formation inhibitor-activating ATPase MinD
MDGMLILPADHTRGEGNITPQAMEELVDDLARLVRWD